MNRQRTGNSLKRTCYRHALLKAIGQFLPQRGLPLQVDDGRQRWTPRMLVIGAILMSLMPGAAAKDAFALARETVVAMYPSRRRPGRTCEGFLASLLRQSDEWLWLLVRHLQAATQRLAGEAWRCGEWVVMGVDGSRVECPMTRENEAVLECAGKKKTTPQVFVTTLFHVASGLPWLWRRGGGKASERHHLREMIGLLPRSVLLLADAGFVGYEVLALLLGAGHDVIVRVGRNVTLLKNLGFDVERHKDIVYLWPKMWQKKGPPLTLRLVTLGKGKRKVCLLTSVLSKSRLSDRQIGKLYRLRWGVEVLYRTFKQTLGHKKLRSDNPRHAKVELDWAMLGLWMLGLMSWQARGRRCRRRWSPAQSVRAVRHAARHAHSPCQREALKKQLRDAVIDEYRRTGSKKARKWPHKKTEKPPGKPKVRMATETEVQTAHKVKQLKLAG